MQEYTRLAYENYLADKTSGRDVPEPIIYCISRGNPGVPMVHPLTLLETPVPEQLVLRREMSSRFILQPRRPVPLAVFNRILREFHNDHASSKPVKHWLSQNDWADAFDDDDADGWMMA